MKSFKLSIKFPHILFPLLMLVMRFAHHEVSIVSEIMFWILFIMALSLSVTIEAEYWDNKK